MKKVLFEKSFKTDVGEIVLNILSKTNREKSILANSNFPKPKNQADVLLSNAIRSHQSKQVDHKITDTVLSVPKVLKGLQYMRRSNNDKSFFIILDRISNSDIQWVDIFNNEVKIDGNMCLPFEFYNELSFMLYKKSLSVSIYDNPEEVFTLAKYALRLLKVYPRTRDGYMDIKCINRCLQLVVKTRSVGYVSLALSLMDKYGSKLSSDLNMVLKEITVISFFAQTRQFPKLLTKLDECFSDKMFVKGIHSHHSILKSTLISILRGLMIEGYNKESVKLLDNLLLEGNAMFDQHDINVLLRLSERIDNQEIVAILKGLNGVKTTRIRDFHLDKYDGSAIDYLFSIINVKLPMLIYGTKHYDSVQTILCLKRLDAKEVKVMLKELIERLKNDKLKRLIVIDILLSYTSKFESVENYISIVNYIIFDLKMSNDLLDSTKLTKSRFPGLYSLFNSIVCSNVHILSQVSTIQRFFDMKDPELAIRLKDYILLLGKMNDNVQSKVIKTKLRGFILYHLLKQNVEAFMLNGQFTIPQELIKVLNSNIPPDELNMFLFTVQQIIDNKDSTHPKLSSSLYELCEKTFGVFTLESIKETLAKLENGKMLPEHYNLANDKQESERINKVFDYIETNT